MYFSPEKISKFSSLLQLVVRDYKLILVQVRDFLVKRTIPKVDDAVF